MLNRLVLAKEMWIASISGRTLPATDDTSIEGMRDRLHDAAAAFRQRVGEIRQRDAWNTAYVDATQQPPNTNTFGASVAHVLAWDAARREIVAGVLVARGMTRSRSIRCSGSSHPRSRCAPRGSEPRPS